MAKIKKMMLGILLTLGMVTGPGMIANATTYTTLKIGDVIKEGDIIDPSGRTVANQQYTEDNFGAKTASADTLTLIKDGDYYGFKMVGVEGNTIEYLPGSFRATDKSDGLYVKDIATIEVENEPFEDGIILAVHETRTQIPHEMITISKTPSGVKAKAAKKGKKVTLTWKKFKKTKKTKAIWKKIKNVEVQYSTDRSFRTGVISKMLNKKNTKLGIGKLKAKTTYYFRVRYVEGPYKVSRWSAVRKLKVKK